MPTLIRRLVTVRLPIELGAFSSILDTLLDAYDGAVSIEQDGDGVHFVVAETVDDDELIRRGDAANRKLLDMLDATRPPNACPPCA